VRLLVLPLLYATTYEASAAESIFFSRLLDPEMSDLVFSAPYDVSEPFGTGIWHLNFSKPCM
jgi:hypothetical protein